ncbi:MAG: hypothetical protein QOD29_5732 [Alphaproteobacteria bacterium]|jgi:hypothetical protein|nr:hypothetical protein [Alphaproteobacteria bacterium]
MRRISFCFGNDVERQTTSCCKRAGAGATLLLFLLARAACADGLQAGQWKTVQSPEIDGVAGPVQETMLCLTQEAVLDLEKTFSPISRTTNSTCERTEHELTPQRLNWRLQCTGQIDMDVAGEFIFITPEHYTATITARSSMLGQLMQSVRTSIDAQRVGDCP